MDPSLAARYHRVARWAHAPMLSRSRFLRSIIAEKDMVSYQGVYYTIEDARAVVQRLTLFADWASEIYRQRP